MIDIILLVAFFLLFAGVSLAGIREFSRKLKEDSK